MPRRLGVDITAAASSVDGGIATGDIVIGDTTIAGAATTGGAATDGDISASFIKVFLPLPRRLVSDEGVVGSLCITKNTKNAQKRAES